MVYFHPIKTMLNIHKITATPATCKASVTSVASTASGSSIPTTIIATITPTILWPLSVLRSKSILTVSSRGRIIRSSGRGPEHAQLRGRGKVQVGGKLAGGSRRKAFTLPIAT